MFDRRMFLTGTAGLFVSTVLARANEPVRMRDLYNKDLSFSDQALSFEGERISVQGFMAPPLKAETRFYVLTARPMSVCPFCESEADWPNDILAVYARDTISVMPFNVGIVTEGTLELGTYEDPDLGFVSRIRLTNANYHRA